MSEPSVTCPVCGRTSFHPEDVRLKYCAACHEFQDDMGFGHGALTPTGDTIMAALAGLEKVRCDLVADLTPILGERHAVECADTICRSAIRSAKRALGVKEH